MSTYKICFHGQIRKLSTIFGWKKYLIWSFVLHLAPNKAFLFTNKIYKFLDAFLRVMMQDVSRCIIITLNIRTPLHLTVLVLKT